MVNKIFAVAAILCVILSHIEVSQSAPFIIVNCFRVLVRCWWYPTIQRVLLVAPSLGSSQVKEPPNASVYATSFLFANDNSKRKRPMNETVPDLEDERSRPVSRPRERPKTSTVPTTMRPVPTTIQPVPTSKVTVYGYNNRRGQAQRYDVTDNCLNLPKLWRDRIESVNTHGTCVQLCEKVGCRGECIKVRPGSPSHNRLRELDFDARTVSLKRC